MVIIYSKLGMTDMRLLWADDVPPGRVRVTIESIQVREV